MRDADRGDVVTDEIAGVIDGAASWAMLRGDALSVLRELPDQCVDAVVTDPPYSSGGQFRGDRAHGTRKKYVQHDTKIERPEFTGDNRDQRSFGYWCALWLSEALRVAKPGAPIVVFTDWRQLPTTSDALQAGGWIWRGIVPWDKTEQSRPQAGRFSAQCEYALWGSAGPMAGDDRGVGVLRGIVRCSVFSEERYHMAGKPVAVMQDLVRICSPGGIVLDPFAGSASTGLAALRAGRRFIGIELGADYHELGAERLAAESDGINLSARAAGQLGLWGAPQPKHEEIESGEG